MADATLQAIGLSVGATTVAAVTSDTAVVRTPVLTYYSHRAPMVGMPWENPLPHAEERGQVITDFVERVGDPVGILASDGSSHRGERVLAEALRALAYLARRERPDVAAVTYPAHWRPQAVEALRREVTRVPEWSRTHVPVVSDVTAAVTALQRDPGLPTRGVVAVCDFGGTGTSLTLVDAADGYRPIGATVRHLDFSGDLIDQALLTQVIGGLAEAGAVDLASTSAIGSLSRLRLACRGAKERLSAATVTALPVDLPGHRGEVRLTRTELDDVMRAPLRGVLDTLEDLMRRNGIRPADLAAVATVGGGAAMVAVTTALSETLRVPVITSARPALSAATGAALRALRGPADDSATVMTQAPASMTATMAAAAAAPDANLAWSQAEDLPALVPVDAGGWTGARPQVEFVDDPAAAHTEQPLAWYRRPALVMAASAAVLLAAVGGIGIALTSESTSTPASAPSPTLAPDAPPAPAPQPLAVQPPAPAAQQAPAPIRTVTAVPAPVTREVRAPAPANPAPPAPSTTTPPPATTPPTTTTPPPTTTSPPTTTPPPATPPTTTPPPTTPPTTTPPPPVTETVTETVQPSPEPEPPAAEPDSTAPDPTPPDPAPAWTMPPMPDIPGLPTFLPQP